MSSKPGENKRSNIRRELKASAEMQGYITSFYKVGILTPSSESSSGDNSYEKELNVVY